MAIVIQDSGNDAGTGSCAPTLATTSAVAGELLVVTVSSPAGLAGTNAVSGYTSRKDLALGNATNGGDLTVFTKIAVGGETSASVTGSGAMQAHILRISGAANPVSLDGTASSATSSTSSVTSVGTGSITTTLRGSLTIVVNGTAGANGGLVGSGFGTASLVQSTTKLVTSSYLPGTTLSGFSDTCTWTTARQAGGLIISFKPLTVTTTKTVTGKGRIQITTPKTVTGKANISNTTLQTITGVANIVSSGSTTPQTITGVSRITITTLKTVQGVSRITNTALKTETGVARITAKTSRTITGVASIAPATTISKYEDYKDVLADQNNTSSSTFTEVNTGNTYYRGLFDPAQFDNITGLYFEVVAKISSGSFIGSAKLFNVTDSVDLSTTITTSSTSWVRLRSSNISIPGAAKELAMYFKTSGGTFTVGAARLVIQQGVTATKKETEILLSSSNNSSSTTPVEDAFANPWLYEASKFDGITGVYFEGFLSNGTTGKVTTVSLYDVTGASTVTSVTHTGATNTRHRSADISGSLVDGHTYSVYMSTDSGGTANLGIARLIIAQSSYTKTQLILTPDSGAINSAVTGNGMSQWDPTASLPTYVQNATAEMTYTNSTSGSTLTGTLTDNTNSAETNGAITSTAGDTSPHRKRNAGGLTLPTVAKEYTFTTSGTLGNVNVFRLVVNTSAQNSTAQTITGVSRITNKTLKTITGVGRITNTTLQTITGKSRIQITTLKTITGVAHITGITPRTTTGVARITAATPKTIQGVARITNSSNQTITGKARITIVTPRTITGVAHITGITPRTITGVANITASIVTTTKTITGVARLTKTVLKTVTGVSRITIVTPKTITGIARITKTTLQTETGKARITAKSTQNITGVARIATEVYSMESKTTLPTTNARLANVYTQAQVAEADLDNAGYVDLSQNTLYGIHEFEYFVALVPLTFTVKWKGKSTRPPSAGTVTLQLYNFTTPGWDTIVTDTTTSAGTEMTLQANITVGYSNYFDARGYVYGRVYQ